MKKRIFAAILAAAMMLTAAPTVLPAANIAVSAAKEEKLAAPKTLKVSSKTETTVTLKWSKVTGADKYAIYQYDKDAEKYVKIKSVSKTTYKITGLDPNTKYSFKVAALVKGNNGKYTVQTKSKAKSVTTNAKSSNTNSSNTNSSNTNSSNGIRPEFKEAMDSYEAFFDEYCKIMTAYANNPSDLSLMLKYLEYLEKYSEMMEKLDKIGDDDLSEAELLYYTEVMSRINKKLLALG
ncbi:MAG: fibronectin type III domain-containing protein [Bacteroides sp.]|nr:fibronectin type III domain-containing protein [Eubacterium sp.]MCM1417326.1 fibronectin type III domain-containing protein [Roseburia sp.]MCM1461481.1 fibronectin type III domain-containing protein [Bacteroides sp.]